VFWYHNLPLLRTTYMSLGLAAVVFYVVLCASITVYEVLFWTAFAESVKSFQCSWSSSVIFSTAGNADAKRILLASPPADWRRQLGRPRITWLSTIQQDLKHHHLTLPEAADLAQNRSLWRMMSTYGAIRNRELHARNDDDDNSASLLRSFFGVKLPTGASVCR